LRRYKFSSSPSRRRTATAHIAWFVIEAVEHLNIDALVDKRQGPTGLPRSMQMTPDSPPARL